MKHLKKLAPLALLGILAFAGCKAKEYEPDPATIPNIPPSGRAAPGGEAGAGEGKTNSIAPPKK
jgi:hypothetical protein